MTDPEDPFMPETRTCPRCKATLRADAPHGLCPACLLKQAMASAEPSVSVPEANHEVAMIAFSCSRCGMKLKVKPEFAGRQSKCPTCKQLRMCYAPSLSASRQ